VIFLLAGVLPLGLALERSGGAQFLADHALGWMGGFGPVAVLATVYFLTALLTEFMSNNATAVLLAPSPSPPPPSSASTPNLSSWP